MRYEEFIRHLRDKAGLDSEEQATRTARATLGTLAERLDPAEREKLAAQLPKELKPLLFQWKETERFMLEEFYSRVSARAEIGYPQAVDRSRAAIEVLGEAISPGQLEEIFLKLPEEYEELFGLKPPGPLSPSRP